MNNYKKSQFNIEIEKDNSCYLWNTLNGSMMRLSTNAIKYYRELPEIFKFTDNVIFSRLVQYGYLIPTEYNEIEFVLTKERQAIYA